MKDIIVPEIRFLLQNYKKTITITELRNREYLKELYPRKASKLFSYDMPYSPGTDTVSLSTVTDRHAT